jgi:hypothetical protein
LLQFTYYAPYYLTFRSGVEVTYFFPSETIGSDGITNYGGAIEVPIELGGHYSFLQDHLIVELLAGPAIDAFSSAGLNGSAGATGQQLYGNPSLGFDSELKVQGVVNSADHPFFLIGLELGYRILASGPLHTSDNSNVLVGGNTVNLDVSGFRAVIECGFAIF